MQPKDDTNQGVVELNGPDLPPVLRGIPVLGRWETYAVSPDRRWIAGITVRWNERSELRENRLYAVRSGARKARVLDLRGDKGAPRILRWSPDSRRILFARLIDFGGSINADGVGLCDVAPEGGPVRDLVPALWGPASSAVLWHSSIAFSPDGKRLLLVQGRDRWEVTNKRLVCRDYATNTLLWMSEPRMAASQPAWSPDGTRVAHIANPDPRHLLDEPDGAPSRRTAQQHLFVRDGATGGDVRQLTRNPKFHEEAPRWEGSLLRFVRVTNTEYAERSLWETHGTGGGMRKVRDLPREA